MGLEKLVPYYTILDDMVVIFIICMITLRFLTYNDIGLPINLILFTSVVLYFIILSIVFNGSQIVNAIQFAYVILRPFVLALYIHIFKIDVVYIITRILVISKVLILINLPMILFNIVKINIDLLTNHDAITGFFPFNNNDSLTILYLILFYNEFYNNLVKYKKRIAFLLIYGILILTTMNMKIILLTFFCSLLIHIYHSKKRLMYITFISILSIAPILVLLPTYTHYYNSFYIGVPVVMISVPIISGDIYEHNSIIGTGPGTFTSPIAEKRQSFLFRKYIKPFKEYWHSRPQTGTLTRTYSSFTALLGDLGLSGVIVYIMFLLFLIIKMFKRVKHSFIYLVAFFSGVNMLALGFFLNNWFWGIESMLLMLGSFGHSRCKNIS